MNELKDKDLREALSRREARRTKPEVPADFCNNIMQETAPKHQRSMIWRWMAAAAVVFILIGVGTTLLLTNMEEQASPVVAKVEPKVVHTPKTEQMPNAIAQNAMTQNDEPISKQSSMGPPPCATDKNLHYAALTDSTYQDPARVDDFIAKLADYNEVDAVILDCHPGDSTIVSKAYVFDDTKELDLFGRLLLVACWYNSKTPGYLLNFTHQQFYFTLKDLRKGQKYLWIAERINGNRIMLQSTRTTIGVVPSTTCYQDYRSKLTQPGIHNQQNI